MARALTLVACALLALLPFALPEGDVLRLGAMAAHEVLAEPWTPAPDAGADEASAEPPAEARTGAAVLLDSAACVRFEGERAGEAEFHLYGAGIQAAPAGHPAVNDFRRSLVRALRAEAERQDLELTVVGERMPDPAGPEVAGTFLLRILVGALEIRYQPPGDADELAFRLDGWTPPTRTSVVPPLAAIVLALLFRRPVLALFVGVLAGSLLASRAAGDGLLAGGLDVARVYFVDELVDPERAMIVLFVVFMLAMVGVMTRSGGIQGTMDAIARSASSVRRTQVATWLMGLVVFFDDYANTILVGSTMRPLSDRFRIAREKLAYLVDSTAAPVAGLAIFSTWIAFQVSTFSAQLPSAGLKTTDGYEVVIDTLPYRFYCVFTLAFVGMVTLSGRDFGPMRRAEARARSGGGLVSPTGKPMVSAEATAMRPAPGLVPRPHRALLPIATFIAVTLGRIAWVGQASMAEAGWPADGRWSAAGIRQMLYDGSGSRPLMEGAIAGFVVACALGLLAGMGADLARAALRTLRSMGIAIAILYLAWMIGAVCADLGTAPYLTALVAEDLPPELLPALLFLLGGAVAFATGSSWSTMSILLPLVVGLAAGLGGLAEIGDYALMVICISAVFEGAIFGDHCSPISDTTVMSSIASASDHIDHVRTQAPYAVTTMVASLAFGYLPCAALGWSPWTGLGLGLLALAAFLLVFGRPTPAARA